MLPDDVNAFIKTAFLNANLLQAGRVIECPCFGDDTYLGTTIYYFDLVIELTIHSIHFFYDWLIRPTLLQLIHEFVEDRHWRNYFENCIKPNVQNADDLKLTLESLPKSKDTILFFGSNESSKPSIIICLKIFLKTRLFNFTLLAAVVNVPYSVHNWIYRNRLYLLLPILLLLLLLLFY